MPKKNRSSRLANPDFRHRSHVPAPSDEEIEKQLRSLLTPRVFASARMKFSALGLRDRVLTLPVMVTVVVCLVWRRLPSLSELLRVLYREGLMALEPMQVSKQALSQRLQSMPAKLFAQVMNEALERMPEMVEPEVVVPDSLRSLLIDFSAVQAVDGSTLEALRRKLGVLKEEPETPLGGKMMVVLGLFTHQIRAVLYEEEARANEKRFVDWFCAHCAAGSLTVLDCGFFSFSIFDRFTDEGKCFVTQMREKTVYKVEEVLGRGQFYRDEIITMGQTGSAPSRHRMRMVSVQWAGVWHRYLTNVLDDERLSARQVCELYRRRWRIEDAFLLTKRLLGLSYLWVGSSNGVEIQVHATWLFYAVLKRLCADVAAALQLPLERISVEMVFRSLYHYSRARDRGEKVKLVPFIVKDAKIFGIIKAERQRHRQIKQQSQMMWASLS
jgi:Transposase DDE domain